MRVSIVKIVGLGATVAYLALSCSVTWAVYGVKMADLHRNPVPPNPVRIWGKVTSESPLKVSDGKNEITVTGFAARMNDLVIVTGNWNGSVLSVTGSSRVFVGPAKTELIYIPSGSFLIGNSGIDYDTTYGKPDELPQHNVTLSAYHIGKYEITRGEYRKFINAGGYSNQSYWSSDGWSWKISNNRTQPAYWDIVQDWGMPPGSFTQTDNHPVIGVSYYEAEAFCKWAGGRLPTEAEWERAARWNTATSHPNIYPWSDTWNADYCNSFWDSLYSGNQTAPVGSYSSYGSPSGCQDMAGNVAEWCSDWYSSSYYSISPSNNPQGPSSGRYRVFRGGSWANSGESFCRCAYRPGNYPYYSSKSLGFRLARSAAHIISVSAGSGGSITPSGSVSVNDDSSQTFTVTPDSGNSISDVIVDGVSQGAISSYTFTNVVADHTISASFSSNYAGEMIYIPASSFLMGNSNVGADALYANWYPEEQPQHSVILSAYSISKYEVTRGDYRKFINAGGYSNQTYWSSEGWNWKISNGCICPYFWDAAQDWGSGSFTQTDNHPVVGVSYYEAEAFCRWAGGRLPTEAEWERAARWNPATSHPNIYPWSDTWSSSFCNNWYICLSSGYQTSPVGSYSSYGSPSGCQDMAGNLWEWCSDWYSETYYSSSPSGNPTGPSTGSYRIFRGGSWASSGNPDNYCRCASRGFGVPSDFNFDIGFRMAR